MLPDRLEPKRGITMLRLTPKRLEMETAEFDMKRRVDSSLSATGCECQALLSRAF